MSGGARRTARFGLSIGQTAGSYRIVDELGGGGMGMVYVAEHVLIGRRAAVKVLRPEYGQVQDVVERFFNEARATTSIRHPGIVEVFDFGYTDDGHAFIVMELLDGVSLGDHMLRTRRLPPTTALVIARRISAALAAAHARGVVHRDLKPDNVFLVADPDGGAVPQVKLLDFGIAKLGDEVSRTHTGVVLGTPLYMSPEQCRGAATCDHRSDLYSLGCVLFEMITGRPPFLGDAAGEVIAGHLMLQAPDLRGVVAEVPPAVADLTARLLAKDPAERGESAAALVATLDRLTEELGPPRRSAALPTVIAPRGTGAGLLAAATPPPSMVAASIAASSVARPSRRWLGSALVATGLALGAVAAALVRTGKRSVGAELDAGAVSEVAQTRQLGAVRPASTPDARPIDPEVDAATLTSIGATDAGVSDAARPSAPDARRATHAARAPDAGPDDVTPELGTLKKGDEFPSVDDPTVPDVQRKGTSRR